MISRLGASVSLLPLADGDAGTGDTLGHMRALVSEAQTNPMLRGAVLDALRGLPRGAESDLDGLLRWVRQYTRFTADPLDVEVLTSPGVMLEEIARTGQALGDCDELATLYAALAEAAGYPTRFRVQGPPGDRYTHVIVEVDAGGRWVPVDPSNPSAGVGWAPTVGIGREAVEMRGLGQDYGPEEYGVATDGSGDYTGYETVNSIPEVTPVAAGTPAPAGDFWGGLVSGLQSLLSAGLPLAERYGAVKPVIGYSATGQPIYAGSTLPVGGAVGAGYTQLTQPILFGLSLPMLLLLGGGAYLLLSGSKRRR